MTHKPILPEQKVVFGVAAETGTKNVVVVLQVPPGGWEYMKDGTCHTFDLTSLGIPVKLMLAGCKDRADGVRVIEEANRARGLATLHDRRDFGIKDGG